MDQRLAQAIEAIDTANAADPTVIMWNGEPWPKERLHGQLVTEWIERLVDSPSEASLIAGRGHHFRRWTRPRSDYPAGRSGYLTWRRDAQRVHAHEIGELLAGVGYEPAEIEQVTNIIQKKHLKTDPRTQLHEDALCLVFLETELKDLTDDLGDEAMVEILAKSMRKMSSAALEQAGLLELSSHSSELLHRAAQRMAT